MESGMGAFGRTSFGYKPDDDGAMEIEEPEIKLEVATL